MSAIAGVGRRLFLSGLISVGGLGLGESKSEMTAKKGSVDRLTVTSSKPFDDVVAAFEAEVGHPNMAQFLDQIGAARTYTEMEAVIQEAVAKSGFIQFARFDLGAVIRKENGKQTPKVLRYLVGNPLIMKEMVKHVADAGSYAPVTVLIDERPDGVHLSYDLMAAFLAGYENPEALKVARNLDAKVEDLLRHAAA